MSRSTKKGPFVQPVLLKRVQEMLNYAEAMNEYCESPSQAPNDSIYKVVELIRKRAELSPNFILRSGTSLVWRA